VLSTGTGRDAYLVSSPELGDRHGACGGEREVRWGWEEGGAEREMGGGREGVGGLVGGGGGCGND
jgi:hypothetical protein